MGFLKETARKILMAPRKKEYDARLFDLSNSYDVYMREQEEKLNAMAKNAGELKLSAEIISLEEGIQKSDADISIYVSKSGILSGTAETEIRKAFEQHPEVLLMYADEDTVFAKDSVWDSMKKKGVPVSARSNPRLKSMYSPETLISHFYMGNIVAVRNQGTEEFVLKEGESLYSFVLRNLRNFTEENVYHLPLILLHMHRLPGEVPMVFDEGIPEEKQEILRNLGMQVHFEKSSYQPDYYTEEDLNRLYPVYETAKENLLSVIIPSKDNPEVLLRCIESVKMAEQELSFEIIVVDNGSSEKNRKILEKASAEQSFLYIYEKEEFNFSRMNNRGVAASKGNLLLMLNDDMGMITPNALSIMAGQLLQNGVGIVGAKLLYPDSSVIQHVGITNAVDGPVHKFIGKDDRNLMDYKRNRFVHNCIGVTGACLMLRRSDYDAVGGLKEDLRVAYNDVDLCFSIREQKKRCVLRPDCVFYHHESLSRGADHLSDEKLKRLAVERKQLYNMHPATYLSDPYEGMAMAGGTELSFDTENRFEKREGERPKKTDFDYRQYPEGIIVHFDRLEKEELALVDGEQFYVLQGYHVVPRIDNMRFRFYMVFEGSKEKYVMPMPGYLRMNLEGGYPEATNLKLSGFCNFVTEKELLPDRYDIGIFADDCLKKLYLYQRTKQVLVIEGSKTDG